MAEEKKLEVLVVDDKEENLKAAKEYFEQLGKFSVDYVNNLKEAKEKLMTKDYFLGIFDLDIPVEESQEPKEKAGIELGEIAKEKENPMFYVYYSGGFFHGTPNTKVYFSEKSVLSDKYDEYTYSKESSRGWHELYLKFIIYVDTLWSKK